MVVVLLDEVGAALARRLPAEVAAAAEADLYLLVLASAAVAATPSVGFLFVAVVPDVADGEDRAGADAGACVGAEDFASASSTTLVHLALIP